MDGRAQQPEDFATSFEAAFARLQVLLEMACAAEGPWADRATAAVRRALEFAAADPEAASVLTHGALAEGPDGIGRYERLMSYVAGLLEVGRGESPLGAELPPSTERSIAGGVAAIVANRVDRGSGDALLDLTPEIVQFVLTPYFGSEEAKRRAQVAAADWPPGQPGR
jgi:hypothetical protein